MSWALDLSSFIASANICIFDATVAGTPAANIAALALDLTLDVHPL